MNQDQYLKILGLKRGASAEQIKKAYRKKARLYHPDLNHNITAADIFISVNEAYEYLMELEKRRRDRLNRQDEITRSWNEYRRDQARERAYHYSRKRYADFQKSKNYRSSMILNKIQLFFSMSIGIFIVVMAIVGYTLRLRMVDEWTDPPSVAGFIFLLGIGALFFLVSLAFILAFYQQKNKNNTDE